MLVLDKEFYSVQECMKLGIGVKQKTLTNQSIYIAIREGRLKAIRGTHNKWIITRQAIEDYVANKYNREKRKDENGEYIFSKERGTLSVSQAVLFLNEQIKQLEQEGIHISDRFDKNRLYYLLKIGQIPCKLYGGVKVIYEKDLYVYLKSITDEQKNDFAILKQIMQA